MAARCTDTIVYRSLPVNGDQLRALKLGQSIKSKNPQATASIRDHVLLGSKADFRSQFISTTGSLDIALKYAVPVHTVIAINLAKYQASCGKVYDLSTEECFAQQVRILLNCFVQTLLTLCLHTHSFLGNSDKKRHQYGCGCLETHGRRLWSGRARFV